MAYSGKFIPNNPHKYVGDHKNIHWRSTWELRCMKMFDEDPCFLSWASEELVIPYISPVDKRYHRYFPDFLVKTRTSKGELKTLLVEVKPAKEAQPPKKQRRVTEQYVKKVKTWAVNQAKWKAAIEYCKDRRWEFIVMVSDDGSSFQSLTESDLMLD